VPRPARDAGVPRPPQVEERLGKDGALLRMAGWCTGPCLARVHATAKFPRTSRKTRETGGLWPLASVSGLTLLGRMCPQCACAVKGALDQRVEGPPEEEVDPLGSYLAGTRGDPRTRSPETEGLERRSSEFAGRNVSEARAGPERAVVEADLAHIQGRPCVQREGRRCIAGYSTGVVGRGM
jgi:hypothetical protein